MAKRKVFIDTAGDVHLVYEDKIANVIDGVKTMKRASNVEFNEASQEWEARYPDGSLLCKDRSRDKCLKEEVIVVEKNLEAELTCQTKR